jgi:hypothetical protein
MLKSRAGRISPVSRQLASFTILLVLVLQNLLLVSPVTTRGAEQFTKQSNQLENNGETALIGHLRERIFSPVSLPT